MKNKNFEKIIHSYKSEREKIISKFFLKKSFAVRKKEKRWELIAPFTA